MRKIKIKPIIASETMLGSNNCFSLLRSENPYAEIAIVNMTLEDFESAVERNNLQDGVWIEYLDGSFKFAIVTDHRIAGQFRRKRYCTICCPQSLWPARQMNKYRKAVKHGDIVEHGDGTVSYKPYVYWPDRLPLIRKIRSWYLLKDSFKNVEIANSRERQNSI